MVGPASFHNAELQVTRLEVGRFAYRLICGVLLGVINVFLDACSHFSNPTIRKARMH